jgi:NAD(P)-dependent dehydrogenase (short-subunit alcohol dehydrogenase family)
MGASRGLGRSVVEEAVSTFACLDVVVNNAGYADIAPIEEVDCNA